MTWRTIFAAILAVLALVSAGCGSAREAILADDGSEALEMAETAVSTPSVVPSELLTPADVEQVSGLTGLEAVPYDPTIGAGGDINIADGAGQLVAMLIVDSPETWDAWLTDGFTVREPVTPPVGDESFIGPSPDVSEDAYIFGFLSGETAVVIDTYLDPLGNGPILSTDDLRALAEIVEGRL